MVTLAVDVGRDRSAERHEARPGHHRRKKSARQKHADDFIERHAGFAWRIPLSGSKVSIRFSRVKSTTRFWSLSAASPYARPAPRAISEVELPATTACSSANFSGR